MVLDSRRPDDDNYVANGDRMKLSEYIFNEYDTGHSALTSDDIEVWIVEWYRKEFEKSPPAWLADWRKK